jgi:E3 SUMO-protein ligase RanBP2
LGAKDFQGFGDLAKNAGTNGGFLFGAKPGENKTSLFGTNNAVPQLFGGSKPAVLFGSQIPKPAETGDDGDEDGNANPEEYEPQVDFRPLVVLQEVEVKTGEEDEEVLFKERCKLFRYSSDTKEWKEKGVGEIKILRHKETNAHRVLMRRDQVLKLCANHRILPEIKLEVANEKQIRWSTNDYSENEAKYEILLAKFRHEDEAKRFKTEFEKAQTYYKSSPMKPVTQSLSQVNISNGKPSLSESIKIEKGTWTCSQCLVS